MGKLMGEDRARHRVHFIGVGGYSMSGLALALHDAGWDVTGSDTRRSSRTERLEQAGIRVTYGHDPDNLGEADWVVYTTDVPENNPERAAAQARGLSLRHRSEILAEVLKGHDSILVTGTHGKTTTTSMVGVILKQAGMDPLILVGGEVEDLGGSNVHIGRGRWAVAEADESDGSFLRYEPTVAVVTNLEPEHLEHYGGRFEHVVEAVARFLARVPPEGLAVLGAADPVLARLASTLTVPTLTFGVGGQVAPGRLDMDPSGTTFEVQENGRPLGTIRLNRPGRHNVDNALAAVAVARHLDVPFSDIQAALARFQGARRRFQEVLSEGGIRVFDDYAVHPTEILATLGAARQVSSGRIVAVWQPHRAFRLRALWDDFIAALAVADVAVVTDLYAPAGEPALPDVDSRRFVQDAARRNPHAPMLYGGDLANTARVVEELARPGDVVVLLGAGDVWRLGDLLRGRLGPCASSS
jgi:UDP-N-acetylmuramate--alanine ligase